MKKIFEMASDMIIPGIIFVSIIAVVTGGALFSRAGQRMKAEGEDFSNSKDTGAVESICARKEPTIACTGKRIWKKGETIRINHVFQASDAEGRAITVEVKDITDESGASVIGQYQASSRTASFSRRGVYTFHLKCMDSERKTAEMKFSFTVDNR